MYTLEAFVSDMDRLAVQGEGVDALLNEGKALLGRLVRNLDVVPPQYREPSGKGKRPNHGTYLMHQSASGISVTAVVWGPGDYAPPHDHGTWGLIGVTQNDIKETRFRRLDDGTGQEYARIEQSDINRWKQGDVSILWPGVDEIHSMENTTDQTTIEVHVYGRDLKGLRRNQYDPGTGAVRPFVTERYDNE